jgi:hypothetical protein
MSHVPENMKQAIIDGQYDYETTGAVQAELLVYLIEAIEEQAAQSKRIADHLDKVVDRGSIVIHTVP